MPETFKAYVAEDWPHDAITIQVTHGEGMRGKTVGVVEHLPGDPDLPPLMRMVPILDLADEATGEPRSQAPRSGIRVPMDAAEAILVALLAWSSSTPGDNPVERAQRAEGERDLALAEVAQLRHDLAVAEERLGGQEALMLEKDDRICALEDHVRDLGGTISRAWPPSATVQAEALCGHLSQPGLGGQFQPPRRCRLSPGHTGLHTDLTVQGAGWDDSGREPS